MDGRRRLALGLTAAGAVGLAVVAASLGLASRKPVSGVREAPPALPAPRLTTQTLTIRPGDTLEALLRRAGVDDGLVSQTAVAIEGVFSARRFRAGSKLSLTRSEGGSLEMLEYPVDPDRSLRVTPDGGGLRAEVVEVPGTVRAAPVCGTLKGSLFESMARAGERPELTLRVADIFGWQLDFYTDPREGDRFCVVVEKKEYDNGHPATYRRILAATYENGGKLFDAFWFSDSGGKGMYYSSDGQSLQSAFLRSPMKFEARVSSRFSRARRHPVLKIVRPHLGTDYAAPAGTPVQAVAAGTVTFAGRSGESGNMLRIRHANGYETAYLHLSRMLAGTGQRVEQGEQIGLVGSTGLATGPHLDFRVSRNGRYVDFERLRLPPATSLSAARMEAFRAERSRLVALMDSAATAPAAPMAGGSAARALATR